MILILSTCLVISGLGAFLVSCFGQDLGFVDIPNERSSHSGSIPKGGGIGILAAFVFACFYLHIPFYFCFMGFIVSLVSFFGDKRHIEPKLRLLFHFLCSLIFIFLYLYSKHSDFFSYLLFLPLVVYIVGTLNFYNFMDGINGIAGITGIVGFSFLFIWGNIQGVGQNYLTFCLTLVFSCLGFLPFNFPRARVFMGDVGSVLLGFVYACMVVFLSEDLLDFLIMVSFLFPFYADELSTMIIRLWEGDNLIKPHRKHLYQILVNECGFNHWKVTLGYGLLQLLIACFFLLIRNTGFFSVFSFLFICFICYSVFSINLRSRIKRKNVL